MAAVAKFASDTRPKVTLGEITPNQVVEFDCAKNGARKSNLVVALDISGRGFYTLWIYSHGSGDNLIIQEIRGWKQRGGLKMMIQDLNGDGVDELIVPTAVGQGGAWTPTDGEPLWPAIYRPENGKFVEQTVDFPKIWRTRSIELSTRYVEASRDFPNYYDTRILPKLDQTIGMLQQKAAEG